MLDDTTVDNDYNSKVSIPGLEEAWHRLGPDGSLLPAAGWFLARLADFPASPAAVIGLVNAAAGTLVARLR